MTAGVKGPNLETLAIMVGCCVRAGRACGGGGGAVVRVGRRRGDSIVACDIRACWLAGRIGVAAMKVVVDVIAWR